MQIIPQRIYGRKAMPLKKNDWNVSKHGSLLCTNCISLMRCPFNN